MDIWQNMENLERALKRLIREKMTWQVEDVGAWQYCEKCSNIFNRWNPWFKEDKICPNCHVHDAAIKVYGDADKIELEDEDA